MEQFVKKRYFRCQYHCPDYEKKDTLKDGQKETQNTKYNKKPTKNMAVNFFHLFCEQFLCIPIVSPFFLQCLFAAEGSSKFLDDCGKLR